MNKSLDKKKNRRILWVSAGMAAALLLLVLLNLILGSVKIDITDLKCLFGGETGETTKRILLELRLPRALMALLLGGALALSGLLLQTFFENPIAGPFVLGISSGAKLAVALSLTLVLKLGGHMSSLMMILASFAGAMITLGLILLVSRRLPRGASLLVAGIMIGYICSAVTDLVINLAEDSNVVSLHSWSLGSFSGLTWSHVRITSLIVIPLFIGTIFLAKPMQAFFLGEAVAVSLGVNVKRFRLLLVLTASLLAAAVTAFAGPISFVGIAVPFLIRRLLRTEQTKVTIPFTFLGGGIFCLLADLLARNLLAPTELSISVVTSILGAPVVIVMLILMQRRRSAP